MTMLLGVITGQSGGSAPAVGSFPTVINVTATEFGGNTTAHLVSAPATTTAGNLLLLFFATDSNPAVTTPTDFTHVYTHLRTTGSGYCFAKIATGSEGGTTVDVVTGVAEAAAAQMYQISNWGGTIATHIASATANGGTTTTPSSPALTSGFGAVDTLWIHAMHTSDISAHTAQPTDFTNWIWTPALNSASGGQLSTARRELNAASITAGAWTRGATTDCAVATVAIKGA